MANHFIKIRRTKPISQPTYPTLTHAVVTWIHRIAITNAAFWIAAISLGVVFGAVPAQAMLLEEVRTWRQTPDPPLGILKRMFAGSWKNFRPAFLGSAFFGFAVALLVFTAVFDPPEWVFALLLICVIWLVLIAMHQAWHISLQPSLKWSFLAGFFMCAWLHLFALFIWVGVALIMPIILLPLVFFLPTLAAFAVVLVEAPARAFVEQSD